MRHHQKNHEKLSLMGKRSQAVQENNRLASALEYGAIRAIEPVTIYEIRTRNPRTGQEHLLEIKHAPANGNNRYTVHLDGDKLGGQWSRTSFCRWLFGKIESVCAE